MWRRFYALLLIVRLYVALCPSYLHPDENFQGPEVIAGRIFNYHVHHTWEFATDAPIRSAFALWPVYGIPMLILRWLWEGSGNGLVPPALVFTTLRLLMFSLSFVLEDWAIHELVDTPRHRRVAIMLIASSYVTWSWQVHTFSNSIETLIVLWSSVLVKRLTDDKIRRSRSLASAVLSVLLVFGTFNRITFPAFVAVPLIQLIPSLLKRPSTIFVLLLGASVTTMLAIAIDTVFYRSHHITFRELLSNPVITPLNSLYYNSQASNLALHGTHPPYQHFLVNLPQLLGPAMLLICTSGFPNSLLITALVAVGVLSLFSHQEARFLIPAVPLVLSSISLPPTQFLRAWIGSWIVFNVLLGVLMGIYHQGGVIPAQNFIQTQSDISRVIWWKTYSPPIWLLNGRIDNVTTVDLMGIDKDTLEGRICTGQHDSATSNEVLVAPDSALYLDQFSQINDDAPSTMLRLSKLWTYRQHLNLDDLDFGDDGIWPTLKRVIGRRGLSVWKIDCQPSPPIIGGINLDW